jgi:hypothetical protein
VAAAFSAATSPPPDASRFAGPLTVVRLLRTALSSLLFFPGRGFFWCFGRDDFAIGERVERKTDAWPRCGLRARFHHDLDAASDARYNSGAAVTARQAPSAERRDASCRGSASIGHIERSTLRTNNADSDLRRRLRGRAFPRGERGDRIRFARRDLVSIPFPVVIVPLTVPPFLAIMNEDEYVRKTRTIHLEMAYSLRSPSSDRSRPSPSRALSRADVASFADCDLPRLSRQPDWFTTFQTRAGPNCQPHSWMADWLDESRAGASAIANVTVAFPSCFSCRITSAERSRLNRI